MASSLQPMLGSYSFASDFAQSKNPDAFTISWTGSTNMWEVARLDLELKWMYFDKILQAIHSKLHVDPISTQTVSEVELIVDSKLLHGNFEFSDDSAVISFICALKRYVQMKYISVFQSRISMYVKHLLLNLERAQRESSEMHVQHHHAARLAEGALVRLREKAELHKKQLCAQLVDLKQNAERVLKIEEKELNELVLVILSTKVEEECSESDLECDAAVPSVFSINSCLLKEEAV